MFGLRKRRRSKDSKTGGRKGSTGRSQSPIRTARRIFHGVCINADAQEACEAARETRLTFVELKAPRMSQRNERKALASGVGRFKTEGGDIVDVRFAKRDAGWSPFVAGDVVVCQTEQRLSGRGENRSVDMWLCNESCPWAAAVLEAAALPQAWQYDKTYAGMASSAPVGTMIRAPAARARSG